MPAVKKIHATSDHRWVRSSQILERSDRTSAEMANANGTVGTEEEQEQTNGPVGIDLYG